MEVWTEIARARVATGDEMLLRHRAGVFEIRCNGWDLISNRAHASEEALARLVLDRITAPALRILIAGLGMGFTLRAALDASPPDARVEVAEILPEIVSWNEGPLAPLNGGAVGDRRVKVHITDVADALSKNAAAYDAIMLDVDNGPEAVMLRGNASLYSTEGLSVALCALAPGGVLGVWSASRSAVFEALLDDAAMSWRYIETPARNDRAVPTHVIYLGQAAS
jgi:spermidine synthase